MELPTGYLPDTQVYIGYNSGITQVYAGLAKKVFYAIPADTNPKTHRQIKLI